MCKKTFFLMFLPLLLLLFPQSSPCAQPSTPFSATLINFEGEVLIQKGRENLWLPVEKDMPLEQGDHLKTGAKGFAEILVDDGSQMRLEENSEITLSELSADAQTKSITASVYLWFGRMLSNLTPFAHSRSKFEVQTPTVVAGVRGTDFAVEVVEANHTDVGVFDGEVTVAGLDRQKSPLRESEVVLGKGYQSSVFRNRPPGPPVPLRERMLLLVPQFELLKKRGVDRRRNLPKTVERRKAVYQETLKKWRAIKNERGKNIETKSGVEQKAPPKTLMENKNKVQTKEGVAPNEKPQLKPKTEPLQPRDLMKKPATPPQGKSKDSTEKP
jgi:FecR protein